MKNPTSGVVSLFAVLAMAGVGGVAHGSGSYASKPFARKKESSEAPASPSPSPLPSGSGPSLGQRPDLDHRHLAWKAIIDRHVVTDGAISLVNYKRIVAEKKPLLDYISQLQAVSRAQYGRFDRSEKLAFLVNAYNAFTVQQVVERYPVGSIRDIEYESGVDVWNQARHTLLGKLISLDELQKGWIGGEFREPLVHFALVCASMGCPGLRWYSARDFTEQATAAAQAFLSDTRMNRYDSQSRTLWLSEIFDWYKKDFIRSKGSVAAYVADWMGGDQDIEAEVLAAEKAKSLRIKYNPYDWSLNDRK